MSAVAIVGAQWGDEGKGKIVDFCTESADVVVRYAGGPNAGHTLVVGDDKLIVRLLPSGILRDGTRCVLGQGMVIDPAVLLDEIDQFRQRGKGELVSRLAVSDRAHLILPYHIEIDGLREATLGGEALGTTKKGIGPAYEDKMRRTGVRTGELRDPERLARRVSAALAAWSPTIERLGGRVPAVDDILGPLLPLGDRITPLLKDTSELLDLAIRDGARVLLEGAQGTLLDVDHGTYPYVTSSTAVAGGAAVGAGIGPNRIRTVLGVTKAYTTRVGAGPFPTELDDASGRHLRDIGVEFGSVTGRPRRTGWLDIPGLRYAARVNGLDGLAITKLDVLSGIDRLRVCVAYDTPSGRTENLPIDLLDQPSVVHPVYQELPGWKQKLGQERALGDLPAAAVDYLRFLEHACGVPIYMVSVGARRDQTIVLVDPFASAGRPS
jgi:adenylosuccinate synthase